MLPEKLANKIHQRKTENALRTLGTSLPLTDFSSNDYLGFSKSEQLFNAAHAYLAANNIKHNGAAGSRLLSGNHSLYPKLEHMLSEFHNSEAALIFNSGYDANIGLFSSLPQRGDVVLYDEHIHASIRDGISMSHAKAYKFKHNNLTHLGELLKRYQQSDTIYVVTESVFSMDGDSPDLVQLSNLCKTYQAYLIIDEAHAIGILGNNGSGLVQATGLEQHVFARLVTYGKALGCHGAAVLGSKALKQYLINFSRSFIYTTALPPHSLAAIQAAYQELPSHIKRAQLHENIKHFKKDHFGCASLMMTRN
ncbi:aminotransferase class I/II-fold pyridoxal phosphate-dependent enzyme [Mangrovimonas yunxiaonensis]|uniref:aminotransferase class I/II-fold pyridoxal phosphate-dependent enzyme n=1 Tax=Mangrovimonas yunxiaonensis TaxID=1197477 RepID=UPI00068DD77E|nr:aminotransferase class I/II-fold pyridoxal phosphate-dependent enzyme [Mangrovimonas yunxiaonensis]GGH36814.1 8-amino-7-oxononanoate synthase [Mangrovimonas yunxiaonensis]